MSGALSSSFSEGFTKAQIFPHYENAKSYYISEITIVIKHPQQRFTKPQTGLYDTRYVQIIIAYHSTSSQVYMYVHLLLSVSGKIPAKGGNEFSK